MLSPEHLRVIIAHMRHSLMSKSLQVTHTSEKCFRLRDNLLRTATRCREDAALMTPALNRQHRLIHSIGSDEGNKKEQAHERRLLTLSRELYQQSGMMQAQSAEMSASLMRSADTLLFTLLKAQHYQWRDRLYMAVLTGESDVLQEESACSLGRWLATEGRRRFCALPGYRELGTCHHEMHEASAALAGDGPSRMSPAMLERALLRLEDLSLKLITALECLDGRVSLLYPDETPSPALPENIFSHYG